MFDWTLNIVETGGYLGIFFLMILENVFPPIPSEVIIPVAGYAAASNGLNIFLVILTASLGAVTGALFWYAVGRMFGLERVKRLSGRYGRWLTLSPKDVADAESWFKSHGHKAVMYGRLIPTVRTLISVPAGIAKMDISEFLTFSFIGSATWTIFLALAGYYLGNENELVAEYLNPVSNGVVVVIVSLYVYRVVTFKSAK